MVKRNKLHQSAKKGRDERQLSFAHISKRLEAYMQTRVYPSEIATTFNYILYDEFSKKPHHGKRLKPVFVGQYMVDPKNPLQTRVFCHQGTEACSPIPIARGVIGRAVRARKDVYVPDVTKDKGHVGCDPDMQGSELVLVCLHEKTNVPLGALDIDLNVKNAFSKKDIAALKKIWGIYGKLIFPSK